MRPYTLPNTFASMEGIVYMVLATWRLRKLREENEQMLELAVNEVAKESLEKGREEGREQGREEEARAAGLPFDEPLPSERE